MNKLITGIHHVTAIASDAQKNIEFYTGILGLRLVKKTVNFDSPDVYHFYYGDETGHPGSILTFFPYSGLIRGRPGNGFVNTISFSVPQDALDYWLSRLKKFHIDHKAPKERFGKETVVGFTDHDGLGLELVFNESDSRQGFTYGNIPLEKSIKGFYGVEIWHGRYEPTATLLTTHMDHELIGQEENRYRFAPKKSAGNFVDVLHRPDFQQGRNGSGTVHHIAFATPNQQTQHDVRVKIDDADLYPTPVQDRQYFKSIYFREPGGVLFEVATSDENFMLDEAKEHLGEALKLPPWLESHRMQIEEVLAPVKLEPEKFS